MAVRCNCPQCRGELEIDDVHVGREVACPYCGVASVMVPAAPAAPAPADVPVAQLVRPAEPGPEEVEANRRRAQMEAVRARLAARERELRSAPPPAPAVAARLRPGTWVLLAMLLAGPALVASGVWALDHDFGESPLRVLVVLAVLAGVLFTLLGLFAGLYRLAVDLTMPRFGTLTDPVRALKAFFRAVRHGRLGAAYQCLAPGERNRWPRRHPPLDLPGMKLGGTFDFSTPKGFAGYWRPLGVSSWMAGCSVKYGRWELLREEGDFALVACQVNLSSSSLSPLVTLLCLVTLVVGFVFIPGHKTGRAQVKAVKLLRRVDGHWYVVCGELLGIEDDPEALAEALRLARAGQGELAALAGQLVGVVA